jgi:CheY-like chemotaxis protein
VNTRSADVRVMVASDNVEDANQILRQVKSEFEQARTSTRADLAVTDFEAFSPEILVLAFDTLEKAQGYYLGLLRRSKLVHQQTHRTVVLCSKEEVKAAFELCKKEYFDDYVLYWPHTYDALRLVMSILTASREIMAIRSGAPNTCELLTHARQLTELEQRLIRQRDDGGQRVAAAGALVSKVEQETSDAMDQFSRQLAGPGSAGWVEVKNADALAAEMESVKQQQLARTRRVGTTSVESIKVWEQQFQEAIEPALANARAFSDKVRGIKPIVLVVDDDALVRQLIGLALKSDAYDMHFANDAAAALSLLRRMRPDVILMDVQLPGLDGVSLTQQLKAVPHLASIPIIMMTGDARRETLTSSIEAGAVGFIVKPFTREALISKLDKALAAPN